MSKKYSEKSLRNANINLDVRQGKVSFSYPKLEKESQGWANIFFEILFSWIIITFITILITAFILAITNSSTNEKSENNLNKEEIISITENNLNKEEIISIILVVSTILLPPLFIFGTLFFFFKDWVYKNNPMIQKRLEEFMVGYNEKIYSNIISKEILIPSFENVILHYKAYGDYGEQLEKVEVKSEPFINIKRKKRNESYYWYAKFTFSEIPKNGRLWVKWI